MLFVANDNAWFDLVTIFPDWAFGGIPRAEPLVVTDYLPGTDITSISIRGSI